MNSRVRAFYKIDPQPEGPAQARQIIAEELSSRLPASVVEDIKLMVSELVTNGIVHGAAEEDVPVMLELQLNGHIRCRVLDHGPGSPRALRIRPPGVALDCASSSSSPTGGGCNIRRNGPKYGSSGSARDFRVGARRRSARGDVNRRSKPPQAPSCV